MKINKKVAIIGLSFALCSGLVGCGENNQIIPASKGADASTIDYRSDTYEWISPDGVHYWIYSGTYRYGIAPRYDSNGNLVIEGDYNANN